MVYRSVCSFVFSHWHLVHFAGLGAVFLPGSHALSSQTSLFVAAILIRAPGAAGLWGSAPNRAHGLRPGSPLCPRALVPSAGDGVLWGRKGRRTSEPSVNSYVRWLFIPGLAQVGPGHFCASDLATPVVNAGAAGWATQGAHFSLLPSPLAGPTL